MKYAIIAALVAIIVGAAVAGPPEDKPSIVDSSMGKCLEGQGYVPAKGETTVSYLLEGEKTIRLTTIHSKDQVTPLNTDDINMVIALGCDR